jgi:NAD(P)-dependent dehydrogenase (short-subunit alcohol dehydrogenase family)
MSERQLDSRMGSPDEVAAGIAFIASSDGRFINGSAFVMDGVMTARCSAWARLGGSRCQTAASGGAFW